MVAFYSFWHILWNHNYLKQVWLLVWKFFLIEIWLIFRNDRKFQQQTFFFKIEKQILHVRFISNSFDFSPDLFCTEPSVPRLITFSTGVLDLGFSLAKHRIHIPGQWKNPYFSYFNLCKFFSLSHFIRCPFKIVKEFKYDSGYSSN